MSRASDPTVESTVADPVDEPTDRPHPTFDRPAERFALAEELGRGGMGRVVAATDVALARTVAIKQALSDRPDDLTRFEREVRITAQLEHPSIVPIYEAARDANGRPYYVMRRIAGEPLAKKLAGDLRSRLALLPNLLAVVDAAAFAHARRIIHRDIKPSNILLGDYGETHLIDWGLARHVDDLDISHGGGDAHSEQLTRAGHVYGTIAYMAPEQARGEPVDMRADVYALGATLFHVLAGKAPFDGLSDAERIAAAATGDDAVPTARLVDIPPELIAIVTKAMAPEAEARYPTAGEFAVDLRAFLAGQLVGAHRYTMPQRISRFVRRHRFAVAAVCLALVVMGVVVGISISNIVREERNARAAELAAIAARREAEAERAAAEDRAEIAHLDRAAVLAATDPTNAAVMTRRIPPTSRHAARARDIIASAAAHGISRGAAQHSKQVNSLAFSPDGRTLASTGMDGRVVLYDVATARPRVLADFKTSLYNVSWIRAGTHVVVTGHDTPLQRIDVTTGEKTIIASSFAISWLASNDLVRYFERSARSVFEVPATGGTPRKIAEDVDEVRGAGDHLVYFSKDRYFVWTGTESRELLGPRPEGKYRSMAISLRGDRAVVVTSLEAIEWSITTARIIGRWPVKLALWVTYGPQGPIVIHGEGRLVHLLPGGGTHERPLSSPPLWSAELSTGTVFLFESGPLLVVDRAGSHELPYSQSGARVIAANGLLVAYGSRDGSVRWLDLQWVTPKPHEIPPKTNICMGTATTAYVLNGYQLESLDVTTSTRKQIRETSPYDSGATCGLVVGSWLPVWNLMGIQFTDIRDGRTIQIPRARGLATSERGARFILGDELRELPADDTTHRLRWRAPAEILAHTRYGNWTLLALANNTIVRLDDASNRVETWPEARVQAIAIRRDGTAYIARGRSLIELGDQPRTYELPHAIDRLYPQHDSLAIVLDSGSVWLLDGDQPRQRTPIGIQKTAFHTRERIAYLDNRRIVTTNLRTGVSVIRDSRLMISIHIHPDGHSVVGQIDGGVVVYHDPVPLTFPEALDWISRTTNAELVPDGTLHWR